MEKKIYIFCVLLFTTFLFAQKKMFVDGYFVKKDKDTVTAKFLIRTNLFNENYISLDAFYRKIIYSTDSVTLNEISDKEVIYLEFTDLQNKRMILTSPTLEPILDKKFDLYVKIVEGKISWFQGLGWDSNGFDLTSFFFRKDKNVIHEVSFLNISEKNAVIDLVGEKDLKTIFTDNNKIKGGNLGKIKKYILLYNNYYKESNFICPYYD